MSNTVHKRQGRDEERGVRVRDDHHVTRGTTLRHGVRETTT